MGKLAEGREYVSSVVSSEAKEFIRQLSKKNKWSISQTAGELLEEIIAIKLAEAKKEESSKAA